MGSSDQAENIAFVASDAKSSFKVPDLGEGITEAKLLSLLVDEGSNVSVGQVIAELEIGKASLELSADFTGAVSKLHARPGSTVGIQQVLLDYIPEKNPQKRDDSGKGNRMKADAAPKEALAGNLAPALQVDVPVSDKKAEVTSANSAASFENRLDSSSNLPPSPESAPVAQESAMKGARFIPASPSVRRFARELGAPIDRIQASASHGRISVADVKNYVQACLSKSDASASLSASVPLVDSAADSNFEQWGPVHVESLDSRRRHVAEKMRHAWREIPHVTQFDDADISALEDFRARLKQGKSQFISLNTFVLHAVLRSLKRFPKFNASLDTKRDQIIYKDYIHLGMAVDTPKGLVVAVLKNASESSLLDLSRVSRVLIQKARNLKLSPQEMLGSSFTVSNLAKLGTTHFTPIINWPELAILGVGRSMQLHHAQDGHIRSRLALPLSLSYDHRVIDGAEAASFLRELAQYLEYPAALE